MSNALYGSKILTGGTGDRETLAVRWPVQRMNLRKELFLPTSSACGLVKSKQTKKGTHLQARAYLTMCYLLGISLKRLVAS